VVAAATERAPSTTVAVIDSVVLGLTTMIVRAPFDSD
jgi:hypothetical protein